MCKQASTAGKKKEGKSHNVSRRQLVTANAARTHTPCAGPATTTATTTATKSSSSSSRRAAGRKEVKVEGKMEVGRQAKSSHPATQTQGGAGKRQERKRRKKKERKKRKPPFGKAGLLFSFPPLLPPCFLPLSPSR